MRTSTSVHGQKIGYRRVCRPARGQLNSEDRENNFPCAGSRLDNMASRDRFGSPVPRQPAASSRCFQGLRTKYIPEPLETRHADPIPGVALPHGLAQLGRRGMKSSAGLHYARLTAVQTAWAHVHHCGSSLFLMFSALPPKRSVPGEHLNPTVSTNT